MFWKKMTISIVLILMSIQTMEVAQADYTFGTVTNLGPTINLEDGAGSVEVTADGLEMYFVSQRTGSHGKADLYVATRATIEDDWGIPVNLGPTVNSSAWDAEPSISADGLSLYFDSGRSDGYGEQDIYVTTRPTKDDPWGTPVNLGSPVNTSVWDSEPYITADDLQLYFVSYRAGGYGECDIYVTTRPTKDDPWGEPMNLGPIINTSGYEGTPYLSSDGLTLFHYGFNRPGHLQNCDIWMARRPTKDDEWTSSIKLGPEVNSPATDTNPCISPDGSILYFQSWRAGKLGSVCDLYQVSIEPIVDLNGDGIVDAGDVCIMIDYWGDEEHSLCDIGPMPWGDGVVDVEDLIVIAGHLFEEIPPAEPVE